MYFFHSPPNPGNQDPTVLGLPRRVGVQKHPKRGHPVPNPPRKRLTSSAQQPWRMSTTFLIMQWTVWSSEALGGQSPRIRRKKRTVLNGRRKSNYILPKLRYFFLIH